MLNLPKRISSRRRGNSSNSDRKLRWFSILSLLNANTLWIMPRPRYGALLNSGLRTMSRSVFPAKPRPVLSAVAASFFDVNQKLGGIVEPHAGVERHDSRSGFVIVWTEAVLPAVVGVKAGMSLEDEVRLPGEPEARVLEMREHRFGIGIGVGGRAGRIVRRRGGRERRIVWKQCRRRTCDCAQQAGTLAPSTKASARVRGVAQRPVRDIGRPGGSS